MNTLQLKLCDIQGRLFELFLSTKYDVLIIKIIKKTMFQQLNHFLEHSSNSYRIKKIWIFNLNRVQ